MNKKVLSPSGHDGTLQRQRAGEIGVSAQCRYYSCKVIIKHLAHFHLAKPSYKL